MRFFTSVALFGLSILCMNAQNWSLVYTKNKVYFTHEFSPFENDSKNNRFWFSQKADSIYTNHDTTKYFINSLDKSVKKALVSQSNFEPYKYVEVINFLYYDTLKTYRDTTYFAYKYENKIKNWKICGKSSKSDTIIIEKNRLATVCDSIYFTTICGTVQDSVKVFGIYSIGGTSFSKISNIKISKNYGLLSYPSFEKLLFDVETYFLPKIEISKIENVSFTSLKLTEVFTLKQGDKRYWVTYEEIRVPEAPGITIPKYTYDIDSIINTSVSEDSVTYQIYSLTSKATRTEKYFYSCYKNIFDMEDGTFFLDKSEQLYNKYDTKIQNADYTLNGENRIYLFLYYNYYQNVDYTVFEYKRNFGITQIYYKSLIGSIVNGVKSGNTNDSIILSNSPKLESNIKIYPNPSSDIVYIDTESKIDNLQIFSLEGNLVLTKCIPSNRAEIDLRSYPKGVYIMKVNSSIFKLIKQ